MTAIVWDAVGERHYETGVDRGVLYPLGALGTYPAGFAWNGLTTFTESPSGAESTKLWADNINYLTLMSPEQLGGTIEAYTYPDEFEECDGSVQPTPGVMISMQTRKKFGLSYRTLIGNDVDGDAHGYKIHLIYGCLASPSEKARASVNDSADVSPFSWEVTTTPVAVTGRKPTAHIVIDSTKVDAALLAAFEKIIYGQTTPTSIAPRLPLPDEVVTLLTPA